MGEKRQVTRSELAIIQSVSILFQSVSIYHRDILWISQSLQQWWSFVDCERCLLEVLKPMLRNDFDET